MLYYIVHNVCLLCYAYSLYVRCWKWHSEMFPLLVSYTAGPPYLADSCIIVSLVHGLNCHNSCALQCRCLALSELSLFWHGVICKRPPSVTTGRSSDLKQLVTLVIPQAAWNRNFLVFSCKVQEERSPNLEEADIQDVFQLSCCWITYEGPQTTEHSVIQRLKNILTLLWRGCSWLLCSKETCGWGIIHFFEADNIIDLSTWWRLSCWQRRCMKRHRKRQSSRRSPLSSQSLQFPLPPYTLSFNHPQNFSRQQWHHSSKHPFMFSCLVIIHFHLLCVFGSPDPISPTMS